MTQARPAALLRDVSFAYTSGVPVLEGANLCIESDDFLAVVGHNGSGKSTLLRLLLGILKPTSGTVEVFGRPPSSTCRRIGYVPQQAHVDTTVPATALDVVLMGRLRLSPWGPWYGRRHRSHALEALDRVGVASLAGRCLSEMSGGQRQRVLIARALAGETSLLLLDEPTTGVDFHSEQELMDLLAEIHRDIPVVVVSHDISLVSTHFRRVACVNRSIQVHPTVALTPDRLVSLYGGQA